LRYDPLEGNVIISLMIAHEGPKLLWGSRCWSSPAEAFFH